MNKSTVQDDWWKKMFKKFDRNNDGYVDWDEAWYYLKSNRP